MLLSRLIYEVVKSTLDLGNEEFIYSAFPVKMIGKGFCL